MRLAEYCRGESGFLLLPIEHLSSEGSDAELAAFLQNECCWSSERVALVDAALVLYWSRSQTLAKQTGAWPRPRIRNLGVAKDTASLRPYAQVLNTSTWSLYDCDLDADNSHPEFVAYLLALGDWMAVTGEITQAPVLSASWWISADETACRAFKEAAKRSQRPDADALRAVAGALPWLTNLRQRRLRPASSDEVVRDIPGTGIQVPVHHQAKPPRLVEACKRAAVNAVAAHHDAWRGDGTQSVRELLGWLRDKAPLVLVTGGEGETLWDNAVPAATDAFAGALESADPIAVTSIRADLTLIDEHSRRFLAALTNPDVLQPADGTLTEGGYAYIHPGRCMIAYNLFEPGMERLSGPPLPFERAMLGARVLHEWAHLADDAGLVRSTLEDIRLSGLRAELATELAAAVEECSAEAAATARSDLDDLCAGRSPGDALAELLLARLPDYRANLIARPFMSPSERETYARHNIRSLRNEYAAAQSWRAIVRYVYEYQYLLPGLALTSIDEPYRYFATSTGFASDFVETNMIGQVRFLNIAAALEKLLEAYAVDSASITWKRP
jgi:hypothetical protein